MTNTPSALATKLLRAASSFGSVDQDTWLSQNTLLDDVCGAAPKRVADHSRETLAGMNTASGSLHTFPELTTYGVHDGSTLRIGWGEEGAYLRLVSRSAISDRACKQLLGLPSHLVQRNLALVQREIRSTLHHLCEVSSWYHRERLIPHLKPEGDQCTH